MLLKRTDAGINQNRDEDENYKKDTEETEVGFSGKMDIDLGVFEIDMA